MYGFHILKHRFTPLRCSLPLWQRYCILLLFIFSHFRRMNCPSLSLGSGREFIFVGQVFQNVISDRNYPTRWIQGQTLARLILPSQNTQKQGLCHEDVHSMVGSMQKITTIKIPQRRENLYVENDWHISTSPLCNCQRGCTLWRTFLLKKSLQDFKYFFWFYFFNSSCETALYWLKMGHHGLDLVNKRG